MEVPVVKRVCAKLALILPTVVLLTFALLGYFKTQLFRNVVISS